MMRFLHCFGRCARISLLDNETADMQQVTETVYRIEHDTLRDANSEHYAGPFTFFLNDGVGTDIYMQHTKDEDNRPTSHPPPHRDNIEKFEVYHVFGVRTLDHLFTWFPDWHGRKGMADAGFVIRVYQVPVIDECHCGSMQVAMDSRDAVLVEEIALTDL